MENAIGALKKGGNFFQAKISAVTANLSLTGDKQRSPTSPTRPNLPASHPLANVRSSSQAIIDNRPWTAADIGQNAIASVLNDPTGASLTQKLDSVSKQALSAIPRTVIRAVKNREFEKYIHDIRPVFERYQECLKTAFDGEPVLFDEETTKAAAAKARQGPRERRSASVEASRIRADPIDTIPAVFFEQDFNLEDPRIFEQVTEFASVATSAPAIGDQSGVSTNVVLQEKLSHYLDTVEAHLVAEIAQRSIEFFAALENIRMLNTETLQCLSLIRTIRGSLANVSQDQAKKGLEVVRRKRRRNNLGILYNAIKMIKEVKKTQPMLQILLNQGDYVGALDLISEANRLLKGNKIEASPDLAPASKIERSRIAGVMMPRTVQLNGVSGLVNLTGQLAEMAKMIGTLMENDFVSLLVNDIQMCVSSGQDERTVSHQWASFYLSAEQSIVAMSTFQKPLSDASDQFAIDELKGRLAPLVMGLVRVERFGTALQTYRDRLMKIVKSVTKQYFPPAPDDEKESGGGGGAGGNDGPLAKRFRALSFDDFFKLLSSLYLVLLQVQRRIAISNGAVLNILKAAESAGVSIGCDAVKDDKPADGPTSPSTSSAPARYPQFINDTADILFAASDLAHVRCGKLLSLRGDQNAQLNSKDFFKLFDITWKFVLTGEWMCQRNCIGLRGTVMTQRMKQLTMLIDNEQWSPAEIPVDFQHMVNRITKAAPTSVVSPPADKSHLADVDLTSKLVEGKEPTGAKDKDDDDPKSNLATSLVIDGKHYHVVPCTLLFLKMLDEYLSCIDNVSALTPDILNRLIEISKLFNTRVCGVIVGGAAVQTAVLKSITAKHLALAGQCLGFVIVLMPFIRQAVEQALPEKQKMLAADFDKVMQDYGHNQEQVFHRIVMIMEERINSHCEGLTAQNWDADLPTPPAPQPPTAEAGSPVVAAAVEPSNYMKQLVKETVKLHRILCKYLVPESIKVFEVYNKRLEQELGRLELYSSSGKNRLLTDVQFFISVLTSLDHIDGPGNRLEVVVNNIRIRDRRDKSSAPSLVASVSSTNMAAPQSLPIKQQPSTASMVAPSQKPAESSSSTLHPPTQQPPSQPSSSNLGASAAQASKKLGTAFSALGNLGKSFITKSEVPPLSKSGSTGIATADTKPKVAEKAAPPARPHPAQLMTGMNGEQGKDQNGSRELPPPPSKIDSQ